MPSIWYSRKFRGPRLKPSLQFSRTPSWQRYSFEHVVRDSEKSTAIARYILNNPLRAGLAISLSGYPFVGSLVWTMPELLD